jgi:deoxyribodipyrimidine photo-lyase
MRKPTVVHWFRQDLRLADNPALSAAAEAGRVMPIYILDDKNAGDCAMGAASRWWLHHSLEALNAGLDGALSVFSGDAIKLLTELCQKHGIKAVYWNRCYEPWRITRDDRIKQVLNAASIETHSFNGSLLWEPWEIKKGDGKPYKVFTPFYRKGCLSATSPRAPLPSPRLATVKGKGSSGIKKLGLLPGIRWDKSLDKHWTIGEKAAKKRLQTFLRHGIRHYKVGRNFPAQKNVSRLSPHLHFGEISPNQLWYGARASGVDANIDCFCSELGWREFSHHLLYYFPELPRKNLQTKFDSMPWSDDKHSLKCWQRGQTGYPMVDAGMRELWQTGYMHNRVRMIVGSFLVKNLRIDWRLGERWFWDCLADADLANNSASWQWIAGCGADAAPFFRIFNPITQGEKFDPSGEYTRRFVPELAKLPNPYLFKPWTAPQTVLDKAGVVLGNNYPKPIVDAAKSRASALHAFSMINTG